MRWSSDLWSAQLPDSTGLVRTFYNQSINQIKSNHLDKVLVGGLEMSGATIYTLSQDPSLCCGYQGEED